MKELLFALLLAPTALLAQPAPPPEKQALVKAVEAVGGLSKYRRLETLTCDFEETVYGSSEPVTVQGRRYFRFHEGGGLRVREEIESPDGRLVTVASSSGSWSTLEDKPVTGDGDRLLAEAFWLTAPQRVRESGRPVRLLPSGFLANRLMDRLAVEGEPLFPGGAGLVLFLDRDSGRVEGASLGDGDLLSFHSFEATKSLLVVPTGRVRYRNGEKIRLVKISNIAVNAYIDDALFQKTPQGAHP